MAPRPGGGITRRLILGLLVSGLLACGGRGDVGEQVTTSGLPVTTSSSSTTTTTTLPAATTTTVATTTTTVGTTTTTLPDIGAEVRIPDGEGPFPAVVLVHGGGWVAGSPALMDDLATYLTGRGYLTVNTPYKLAGETPGFPQAVDDVACAARYAVRHPLSDGTVTLVGYSAGAQISALVALDEGRYGEGCPIESPVLVDRLVGLAGPYEVGRLGPLLLPFFGVTPADDPETWRAGDPLNQVGANPGLEVLLLHGEQDTLVDLSFATDFADALSAAEKKVEVDVIPEADHTDMRDPAFVGEVIAAWLAPPQT